jgi:hypothetical protein
MALIRSSRGARAAGDGAAQVHEDRLGLGVDVGAAAGHCLGQRLDQRARPGAELAVLRRRDAEQLGDHDGRQRLGDVVDHVEAPLCQRVVEQLVHEPADRLGERGHAARREGLAHEAAHARVVRRVHHEQRAQPAGPAEEGAREAVRVQPDHVGAHPVHREAPVLERQLHVRVAGQQPDAGAGLDRDRHLEHRFA